jgi:integrase
VKEKVLTVAPAVDLERRKPETDAPIAAAQEHCWSAAEARRVIEAAKTARPQMTAFVFLALDTGARKSELHGLTWADVDLETGVLTIARQLDAAGEAPAWGPTKTKKRRTVTLGAETIVQLRARKRAQPPHVVAARLGHSVMELMKTYAHALPNMQQDAATRLGALLHG